MKEISHIERFLLVSILPQKLSDEDALDDLKELKSLVEAFGGEVCELITQQREVHAKGWFIGRGKVEEVSDAVEREKIDIVVLNAKVNPAHILSMKNVFRRKNPNIQVWDRIDLILEIFAKHAHSSEAKLQIELASMRHMGPRIYGMGMVLSRQGGGIGTLGIGETNTELMRRHWRDQMKKVKDKIAKHTEDRVRQLERRARNGVKTVSIIGYTNAGKTSLFNKLTGKKNIVENALFVTLDSSTAKIYLQNLKQEILISDTIGFIRNLPPSLIDAFKSTLLESINADVLLFVIDVSDENRDKKIKVVEDILYDLGVHYKPRIYVFNKIDAVKALDKKVLEEEYSLFTPQFISVKQNSGIDTLLKKVEELLQTPVVYTKEEFNERKVKKVHI